MPLTDSRAVKPALYYIGTWYSITAHARERAILLYHTRYLAGN